MIKLLFLFPGQGAQYRGMGQDLFLENNLVRQTYEEANDIVGYDLTNISFHDEEEQLLLTRYTQPALLTHSIACMRSFFEKSGGRYPATIAAGHSLGEYSALVAANYLTFPTALELVQKRGELMSTFGRGEMLALPITRETAENLSAKHCCGVAACNLPEQTVIGGLPDDLDHLVSELHDINPQARPIRLQTEGAFHTYYMVEAAIKFRPFLEAARFDSSSTKILSNYSGTYHDSDANSIRAKLFLQLFNPVLWSSNLSHAMLSGVTHIIEFGGGIGKGSHPNDKKPNLASIVKRTLRGSDNAPQYHAVISVQTLEATVAAVDASDKNIS